MKTDFILKSCKVNACKQNSFISPKALSVPHRNSMEGGIKAHETSWNQRQQTQHMIVARNLSPGVRAGGHLEFNGMSEETLLLYAQIPPVLV